MSAIIFFKFFNLIYVNRRKTEQVNNPIRWSYSHIRNSYITMLISIQKRDNIVEFSSAIDRFVSSVYFQNYVSSNYFTSLLRYEVDFDEIGNLSRCGIDSLLF